MSSRVLPIGATRIGRTAVENPDGLAVRHDPRQIGDVPLDQPAALADVDLELANAPLAEEPLPRDGQRLGTAVRAVEDLGGVQELPPAAPGAADLPRHGRAASRRERVELGPYGTKLFPERGELGAKIFVGVHGYILRRQEPQGSAFGMVPEARRAGRPRRR